MLYFYCHRISELWLLDIDAGHHSPLGLMTFNSMNIYSLRGVFVLINYLTKCKIYVIIYLYRLRRRVYNLPSQS